MIHKDEANPMWFGFKGGEHVLVRSFHGGPPLLARNFSDRKRRAFLDWAERQGYNMLSVNDFQEDLEAGGRWDLPDLWPLDAAEYRQIEEVLDDLARREILFYSFGGLFPRHGHIKNEADQSRLIRYYLARFGPYWNVVLNVAGWEAESYFGTGTLRRLGGEVAASDVFGHLLSVHTKDIDRHHGGVYPFRDEGWNSNVTFQGLETYSLDEKGRVLRKQHTGRQPVYAQETIWVGNDLQARGFSLEDLRKGMWVHMMSATAFNNGDMDGNNTSGFSGSLDFADKVQARHDIPKMIWDFMETVPFYQMRPRQDLVTEGFCLAEAGAAYLVYLPNGGRTDVDVERGRTYEVTWVNARNPAKQAPGGKTKDGRGLRAPDTEDWVLHLRRVKDDAPSEPATNKPPVVALEAPADGDVFAAPADLRIEADASDADGSVVKVAFYADGAKLGEDRRPPVRLRLDRRRGGELPPYGRGHRRRRGADHVAPRHRQRRRSGRGRHHRRAGWGAAPGSPRDGQRQPAPERARQHPRRRHRHALVGTRGGAVDPLRSRRARCGGPDRRRLVPRQRALRPLRGRDVR